jgi:hypothetical protein
MQGRLMMSCLSPVAMGELEFSAYSYQIWPTISVFRWPKGPRISRPSPHILVSNDECDGLEYLVQN